MKKVIFDTKIEETIHVDSVYHLDNGNFYCGTIDPEGYKYFFAYNYDHKVWYIKHFNSILNNGCAIQLMKDIIPSIKRLHSIKYKIYVFETFDELIAWVQTK